MSAVHEALGAGGFETAWSVGQGLTVEEAVHMVQVPESAEGSSV